MKNYLLSICVAAALFGPLYGGGHKKKHSSSSSESTVFAELANASAQDTTDFPLTTVFQEVPFTQEVEIYGEGIQAISAAEFQLAKGIYQVTYSGVSLFSTTSESGTVFNDFALCLNNIPVIEFQDSGDPLDDNIKLKSFTAIVSVDTTAIMSIQAQLDPLDVPGDEVTLQNRTLCIVRLQ